MDPLFFIGDGKIMDKITEWGQVRLICPCGGDPNLNYDFDLKRKGGLIYYKCTNPECKNEFSSDLQLKVMDLLNRYYNEKNTFDGFSHYFRIKEDSMRLRYIETINITDDYQTVVVEVTNLTKQPQYKQTNQFK